MTTQHGGRARFARGAVRFQVGRWLRGGVAGLIAGAVLAGTAACTRDGADSAPPGGMSRDEAVALLADYDKRNNPAILTRGTDAWKLADTGVILEVDKYSDLVTAALKAKDPKVSNGKPVFHDLRDVVASGKKGAADFVILSNTYRVDESSSSPTSSGTSGSPSPTTSSPKRELVGVTVFTRNPGEAWLMASGVSLPAAEISSAISAASSTATDTGTAASTGSTSPGASAPTPSGTVTASPGPASASDAIDQIVAYINTGKTPTSVPLTSPLTGARELLDWATRTELCQVRTEGEATDIWATSKWAAFVLRCETLLDARPGMQLVMSEYEHAVNGDSNGYASQRCPIARQGLLVRDGAGWRLLALSDESLGVCKGEGVRETGAYDRLRSTPRTS